MIITLSPSDITCSSQTTGDRPILRRRQPPVYLDHWIILDDYLRSTSLNVTVPSYEGFFAAFWTSVDSSPLKPLLTKYSFPVTDFLTLAVESLSFPKAAIAPPGEYTSNFQE
ncbi:MAG: hypothetical protein AB4352_25670 [Hormoscilla sp.]